MQQPLQHKQSTTTGLSQILAIGVQKAQTPSLDTIPVFGTIELLVGKIVFKTKSGIEKPIPDELIQSHNLNELIGKEAEAIMDLKDKSIVGIKHVKNPYVVKKTNRPIVPPKANVRPETIHHSFDRHTLRGIFRLGKLETAYTGDNVALFPLDTTYRELETWINKLHGETLAWKFRDSSQCTAERGYLKVIGTQTGNVVEIETAFPTDYSLPKEFLQSCLDEDKREPFQDFEDFLSYVESRLKPKRN